MHGHICNILIWHNKLGKTWKKLEEASGNIELVEPLPKSISICQPYVANWGKQSEWASEQDDIWGRGHFFWHPRQSIADQVIAMDITNNSSNQNNDLGGQDSRGTKRL